jgi:hypothetical protein
MQTMNTAQQTMFNALIKGNIVLPNREGFVERFGEDLTKLADNLINSAWYSYVINKGSINLFYHAEKFGKENITTFNNILELLSDSGWLICNSDRKARYAEVYLSEDKLHSYINPDLLEEIRRAKKFKLYLPKVDLNIDSTKVGLVKRLGKVSETGLQRPGFAKSSRTQYYYDTTTLANNYETIIRNVNKGMTKVRAKWTEMSSSIADYDSLSVDVVNHIIAENPMMDLGESWLDTRGRAIKGCLSKVANPIGYKDFRALLTIPADKRNVATPAGEKAIYLFIAELNGWKADRGNGCTVEDKTNYGRTCYESRTLPERTDNDLYEVMWLERLYADLDTYHEVNEINTLSNMLGTESNLVHKWSVPIELDASASMLSYMGCLLGDFRLLQATNTIVTDYMLRDPWGMTALARELFKSAAMKITYGSSQSITQLWTDDKLSYTPEQVAVMNHELKQGGIGVANDFKEFIIKHVKPTGTMTLDIYGQQFQVSCNRHRKVADHVVQYDLFNTATGTKERINHMKTQVVDDLDNFKRWFVTGLIHNLDSYVADKVVDSTVDNYGWAIDIHDAFIVCPEAANHVRTEYANKIQGIYENRGTILNNYFRSINIGSEAVQAWSDLMAKVQPVENFQVNPMMLK